MKFTTKLLDVMQDRKNLIERLQNESNSGVLLHSTFIISELPASVAITYYHGRHM